MATRSIVRINAQEVCQTRICIAMHCGDDAEPSGYCRRHERSRRMGIEVPLHRVIQPKAPNHDAELWCSQCLQWLPDAAFQRQRDPSKTGHRRLRRAECRACCAKRRNQNRLAQNPEARAIELAKGRERNARRRARLRAERLEP